MTYTLEQHFAQDTPEQQSSEALQEALSTAVVQLRNLVSDYPAEVQMAVVAELRNHDHDPQAALNVAQEIINQIEALKLNPDQTMACTRLPPNVVEQVREQERAKDEQAGQVAESLVGMVGLQIGGREIEAPVITKDELKLAWENLSEALLGNLKPLDTPAEALMLARARKAEQDQGRVLA